jgi:hypothetical protein
MCGTRSRTRGTRWTVTVQGTHETETITATSHHRQGDHTFVLQKGSCTKPPEYDTAAAAKFAGTWTYGPNDMAAGVTVRTTVRIAPDGAPTMLPNRGQVAITGDYGNRITARTGNGCAWSLAARGITAKLDPPIQTCTLQDSTAITFRS